MARYEHLPIYKKAMDLTIYGEQIVRNFSRYHKYTLGSELRHKSQEKEEIHTAIFLFFANLLLLTKKETRSSLF